MTTPRKKEYRTDYISLADLRINFDSKENLLRAFREGALTARGIYRDPDTEDGGYVSFEKVPTSAWFCSNIDWDNSTLNINLNGENYCNHQGGWYEVQISKEDLNKPCFNLLKLKTGPFQKYNWENIYEQLGSLIKENGVSSPPSETKIMSLIGEIDFKSDMPGDTVLKERIRPIRYFLKGFLK